MYPHPMRPLAASTLDATSPARPTRRVGCEVVAQPEPVLAPGARAGDFVIEHPIGRGSFGTVYRASHAVIGRRAAVKVLRAGVEKAAGEERAVASFVEEARLVARLRHPNIVDVLTFGRLDDGRHFQVMDLIDGPTVAELVRERGPVPPVEAMPILRGVASALDAVHRAGVVHRDLKPANVVLERRDGAMHPKLIDFGVARLIAPLVEPGPEGDLDVRGGSVGTPRYMSPEQCRGRRVDARADAYAFGLLAYELLTGHPAFAGEDGLELMLQHTSESAIAPSRREPTLTVAADALVLALLEKDPEKRPVELVPIVEELERALVAAPPSARPRETRRGWIAVLGVATVGLTATVLLGARSDRASPLSFVEGRAPYAEPSTHAASSTPASAPTPAAASRQPAEPAEPPRAAASAAPVVKSAVPRRPAPSAAPGLEDPENPFRGR